MSIKEIISNDNMAEFEYYRDGNLWYSVTYMTQSVEPREFRFPVPISDIGTAVFNRVERAMLMMRYIRKQLKIEEVKSNDGF